MLSLAVIIQYILSWNMRNLRYLSNIIDCNYDILELPIKITFNDGSEFCLAVSIVSSGLGWSLGYLLSKDLLCVKMNSSCNICEISALQPQFILGCQTQLEFMANSCLISQHSSYGCPCQHHPTWKRQLNNQSLLKKPGGILAVKQRQIQSDVDTCLFGYSESHCQSEYKKPHVCHNFPLATNESLLCSNLP